MDQHLFITESGKILPIEKNTFYIFVDETGNELLKDSSFPVFGLGGCAGPGDFYYYNIHLAWESVKKKSFNGIKSLHASELRNPNNAQLKGLNDFFINNDFCRFASVISDRTILNEYGYQDLYRIVASNLLKRICDVAKYFKFKKVKMIFEESERCRDLQVKNFSNKELKIKRSNKNISIPVETYVMSKKENEAGLEVADFVIHTAGCSVVTFYKYISNWGSRRDFKSIFQSVNEKMISFFEILEVKNS